MERKPHRFGVKVKLVSMLTALEALKHVLREVHGKDTGTFAGGLVDGARSAKLVPSSCCRSPFEQVEHLGHRHRLPQGREVQKQSRRWPGEPTPGREQKRRGTRPQIAGRGGRWLGLATVVIRHVVMLPQSRLLS